MIGQLCGNFFTDYGILIILVVFLVFMLVFSASKRKKDAKMAEDFVQNLKVGDKIKTYSGIYGKIISIKNTPNGKVAIIETGEGNNVSYMTVDVFAILNIETPVKENKISNDNNEAIEDAKTEEVKEEKEQKEEKKSKKSKAEDKKEQEAKDSEEEIFGLDKSRYENYDEEKDDKKSE